MILHTNNQHVLVVINSFQNKISALKDIKSILVLKSKIPLLHRISEND